MAADKITYPGKASGDFFVATEANEIKSVVNAHADDLDTNTASIADHESRIDSLEIPKSGWATYDDTTYTSGSPLSLVATTDTTVPNNSGSLDESQKPADISGAMYSQASGNIPGRLGDSIDLIVEMIIEPSNATQWLEIWIDAGGSSMSLYRQTMNLLKGIGIAHYVKFSIPSAVMNADFGNNDGIVKFRSSHTADVYDIKFTLGRPHKAN